MKQSINEAIASKEAKNVGTLNLSIGSKEERKQGIRKEKLTSDLVGTSLRHS